MKVASTEFNGYRSDSKTWTDKLLRHNISHMEIAVANLPENEDDQHKIISYALAQGIALNLHAPYGINNISSTDKELRAFSIANVKRSIDLAAKYNLGVVTFHPGRLSDEKDDPEKIWSDMLETVADLAQYAKEKQVYIGLENMELRPYELVFTIEDLNRFAHIGENNPYFGVTIDFAHYATLNIGLPDLRALKLPVHDVHLSQVVDGKPHISLARANGAPDVDAVCRLLMEYGYDGFIVLEHGIPLWESLEILDAAIKALQE